MLQNCLLEHSLDLYGGSFFLKQVEQQSTTFSFSSYGLLSHGAIIRRNLAHFVMLNPWDCASLAIQWILEHYINITRILLVLRHCHGSDNWLTLTYCQHIFQVQDCLLPMCRPWSWPCITFHIVRKCTCEKAVELKYHGSSHISEFLAIVKKSHVPLLHFGYHQK